MTPEFLCLLMFITTCGFLLWGYPVAFTLAGCAGTFALIGSLFGMFDLSLLTAFPQRILAIMSNEVLVAVPLFVFMGVMLERSKIAEDLLDNMGRMFGNRPGGLVYSVTLVGALLAASTGIVGATVVTMGLLSLPVMLARGYSKELATGAIAASGTLGQIIPPSIVLVLLGDQLSTAYQKAQFDMGQFSPDTVSVNDLFAGALIPGLMLVGLYLAYQFFKATQNPALAPPVPPRDFAKDLEKAKAEAKEIDYTRASLTTSLFAPLLLIILVLGSILGGLATPTEAASIGAVGATCLASFKLSNKRNVWLWGALFNGIALLLLVNLFDLRLNTITPHFTSYLPRVIALILAIILTIGVLQAFWRVGNKAHETDSSILTSVMRSTMEISSMVFIILVGAAMFSLVFRGFGGDEYVEHFLENMPGGTITAIFVVMLVMFLMGFFLDFLEIIFIVVPIVAPILLQMEIAPGVAMSPVWLGVLMAINLQTSFLTPPFGFALFYLRGVAPDDVKTIEIYRGIIPYVLIQIFALIILWFWPALSTWLPKLLYG